jgi:N-acetylmuramoyl-L-alanine amidase
VPRVLALAAAAASLLFGHSADDRPLRATRVGEGPVKVLVVGSIHGNETAGRAVISRLRRATPPAGVELWLVDTVNPDGVRRGTRQNARGVDLNRNFGRRWAPAPRGTYYSGRSAFSEPESRAVRRLVRRLHPAVTVWYHQHMRLVNLSDGVDRRVVRAYARRVGLPARQLPRYHGTATGWQNHTFPGTSAFVVELPAGPLSAAAARRHARAVLAAAPAASSSAAAKPPIVWRRIPFGAKRRAQTRAYAKRHYGTSTDRLQPKVIVEHYTVSSTFSSAWSTFASNAPDVELHERPGVCSHFIVDKDGTIYQLVSLKLICRHTVGLNDRAIGIEHVGYSDAEILGRPKQLRASLRLTRWLQSRYGIATKNVIGHSESLSSPYHHERVKRLRTQTHGDWTHADMRRYRAKL